MLPIFPNEFYLKKDIDFVNVEKVDVELNQAKLEIKNILKEKMRSLLNKTTLITKNYTDENFEKAIAELNNYNLKELWDKT